jgi:hypothetical protein
MHYVHRLKCKRRHILMECRPRYDVLHHLINKFSYRPREHLEFSMELYILLAASLRLCRQV